MNLCIYSRMPHLITNQGYRQTHPLYRTKSMGNATSAKGPADSPEKTTAIPKTYDAIKSAAGADVKVKGTQQALRKK